MKHPTKDELLAASTKTVPDVIAHDLQILFCGINPGLYTAWVGHHFGRPGNRFWPAMFASGFTPRLFDPREDGELLSLGIGITNLVPRATNLASQLSPRELISGKEVLITKVKKYRPRFLAVLGVGSFRTAFSTPTAQIGLQPGQINSTKIWLLPNPSGLNAHFTPPLLKSLFQELHQAVFSG